MRYIWRFKDNISLGMITAGAWFILATSMNLAGAQRASASSTTSTSLPKFEIASVRQSPPEEGALNTMFTYPGGRMLMRGCMLEYLLMEAFHLPPSQITGIPGWTKEARYNIEAKPPLSSISAKANPNHIKAPPNDEQREMLQSLLIERFKLAFHRTYEQRRVYVLTANQAKLRLMTPKNKDAYPWAGGIGGGLADGEGLRGVNISMPQLSERLGRWLKFPVCDKTNLNGAFDFEYKVGEGDSESALDIDTSIFSALKGIGLNLKTSTGPVEVLVIDHVERPSEN